MLKRKGEETKKGKSKNDGTDTPCRAKSSLLRHFSLGATWQLSFQHLSSGDTIRTQHTVTLIHSTHNAPTFNPTLNLSSPPFKTNTLLSTRQFLVDI